jgi:pimeloyl-ACP methyl ester carboxylesterase
MLPPKRAFVDYGGSGAPLHFLHANGYPFYCYGPLLDLMQAEYHVFGMLLRPLWEGAKPEEINDWHVFSDDLLRFLTEYGTSPVIGVGHSIGAIVTLRAALHDPEKFKALVLIEPVLLLPRRLIAWNTVRALGLGKLLDPKISGALKRRRNFDNMDTLFRGYRNREVFKYLSDANLRKYIEGMTRPTPDGKFELVFSPEWEARIYFTGLRDFDIWRDLPKLQVPTLFLRGAESDTFLEAAARRVDQRQPRARIESLPRSTHLLPLEYPQQAFDIMQSFLREVL